MMSGLEFFSVVALIVYIAVCFGKIAEKHGQNPILFGVLSVITPINLIILGYWAFSEPGYSRARRRQPR